MFYRKMLMIPFAAFLMLLVSWQSSAAVEIEKLLTDRGFIRHRFDEAQTDSQKVLELTAAMDKALADPAMDLPAVNLAYYGALKGLEAKFRGNPIKKLSLIKKSLQVLDEAVLKNSFDLEVRFVRFASLHHFPAVLGIGKKRGQDIDDICAQLVLRDYSVVERYVQKEMVGFMLKSRRLDKEQVSDLRKIQKELAAP